MKGTSDPLQSILKDLQGLYKQLVLKLVQPSASDNPFSRKSISQLSNKIYTIIETPFSQQTSSQKQGNQNKEILLQVFRSHLTNYINNHILSALIKSYDDSIYIQTIIAGWAHFKRFVMTYHTLLIHANDFYEKESVNAKSKDSTKELSILPLPALALTLFSKLIIDRYQNRIERIVSQLLQRERERQNPQDQQLQTMLSMLWSCSLRELGRMTMDKQGNIIFWRQKNRNITIAFEEEDNEKYFLQKHLKLITSNGSLYYSCLYRDQLSNLHAKEQVEHLDMLCHREQQLSVFQMPSSAAAGYYLVEMRKALLADLEGIVDKYKGFKSIFMDCTEHPQDVLALAMRYFSLFKYISERSMSLICKIMAEAITEKGKEINDKMGKSREHITLMLKFKRAVRRIFDFAGADCLQIQQTMQKTFKKLLQSLQCTKNLAEYADSTIKECIRLKLDDEGCQLKFKDTLFLLMSVSAKDSFLLHYQEYLAKRLLETLNEPRTDLENLMLKLLGEQLGNVTISHHLAMVKDIEKSVEASEAIHNRIPFVSYKWDLRVFNPSTWPQSASRLRFTHFQPPKAIKLHTDIIENLYLQQSGKKLKIKFDKGNSLFQGQFASAKVRFQAENSYLLEKYSDSMVKLRSLFADKKEDFRTSPIYQIVQVLLQHRLVVSLLTKETDLLQPDDIIQLNRQYKPPQGFKPQIPVIIKPSQKLMSTFKDYGVDEHKIMLEREKLIEAVLVKLLKHANSTKGNSITIDELYEGVQTHSFLAHLNIPLSQVKARLQYLISNEYCSRNEDDRRIYHYIA